ncbi:MAG: response regulator [Gammaproteobacteria bacterium]|nr:response regulator [Gammaproteobacteria bacterium]
MLNQESVCMKTELPQRNILLVDDEENITRSLVRLLRQDDYRIYTAKGGEAGLEILKQHKIGVILSDQRMPEMSGTDFLRKVRELYPGTIRIVLSGYTDLKTITDAINEGEIYKFLTKPWDDSLLRANIADAFKQYELESENEMLWKKLEKANAELLSANLKLEKNVTTQARSAQLSMVSLKVSQDILQSVPVGVVGIDDNGTIVLANEKAHQILSFSGVNLIGNKFESVVTEEIRCCCNKVKAGGSSASTLVIGGEIFQVIINAKGERSISSGWTMVLVPK